MKPSRRPKLSVERLEQRDCPSFVIRLASGTLFVTGSPAPTGTLSFTQTANNRWQVQDGTTSLGTYNVDNINLSVTEHNNVPIVFNLNGNTDSGNILINLGNGNSGMPSLTTGTSVYNGTLAGNLTLLNGSGHEFITLGYLGSAPSGTVTTTIGGSVIANLKDVAGLTSGSAATGNLIDTGFEPIPSPAAVTIGGSITATGVSAVQLWQTTTVGQNVTVSAQHAAQDIGGVGDVFLGTIGGNLTINGASSSSGDIVDIGFGGVTATPTIGGNVNINLGNGNNQLQDLGPFVIGGSTNIQMGDGNSSISLGGGTAVGTPDGTYNGNLTVQLGNGNNTDGTTDPNFIPFGPSTFIGNATVGGNFSLTAGNGNNTLTQGGAFAGTVNGSTNFMFGSGTDSIAISSSSLAGPINWHSGNGNDSLTFTGAPAPTTYNVNAQFGNLDDVFTFDDANSSLTGSVNGGGRINGNQFNFVAGTIVQPFTLSNFP